MFVHGDNLKQKENSKNKYGDKLSKEFLLQIRQRYDKWKNANLNLFGPTRQTSNQDADIISHRVKAFNEYKDFLDQQHFAEHFDSRSNLHSSVLEEFLFYLFKDLVSDFSQNALIGKSHAFKDIFFKSDSYMDMINQPKIQVELKDHDFVIGAKIEANFKAKGAANNNTLFFDIPAIVIECKTYLDKTMLEGSSTAAEQLKIRNPNALYFIVCERLKLTEAINLKKYKLDQIYILRKQKNTDREFRYMDSYVSNPIYEDVVWHLFHCVREYLNTDWQGKISDGLKRGYLI